MIPCAESFGQVSGVGSTLHGLPVGLQEVDGCVRRFVEEFNSESTESGIQKVLEMGNPGLGACIKDGIAATDVGSDGVRFTHAVAHCDTVVIAGATASEVVFSLRQESGKYAMLHMEHGNVLMQGAFKPRRGG